MNNKLQFPVHVIRRFLAARPDGVDTVHWLVTTNSLGDTLTIEATVNQVLCRLKVMSAEDRIYAWYDETKRAFYLGACDMWVHRSRHNRWRPHSSWWKDDPKKKVSATTQRLDAVPPLDSARPADPIAQLSFRCYVDPSSCGSATKRD